jgi:gluconate 2-dehydrogenase gamma chain
MNDFFDENYKPPAWLTAKAWFSARHSRRHFLKAAAGASAVAMLPKVGAKTYPENWQQTPLWQTLNAVLDHLLPQSKTGPSAQDIQATQYLYNVITQQPTSADEIAFIEKGVQWLNGYSQSQLNKPFVLLNAEEKETILRGISQSTAGENWLSTLLSYLFEAMLAPPVYGGNPQGIGEKWLNHQAGFPLPKVGTRYYELPGAYRITSNKTYNQANSQLANNKISRSTIIKVTKA